MVTVSYTHLQGNLKVIVKTVYLGIDLHHFTDQLEFGMQDTSIGLQVDLISLAGLGTLGDEHFAVVHIHALAGKTYQIDLQRCV